MSVVDDQHQVLRATTALLESYGIRTLQANNGNEALELMENDPSTPIDVVLLDRTMPGLDGWQTMQEMSRLRPNLPVILCSGYLPNDEQQPGEAAPAAVLQKPYSITELKRVLHTVIDPSRKPNVR